MLRFDDQFSAVSSHLLKCGGRTLHMTHISRRQFPSLMEDAYAILLDACGISSTATRAENIMRVFPREGEVHV